MCTNYTPTRNASWVRDQFGVDLPGEYPAEAYPSFASPLVVRSHQSGRVACGLARFGLIPSWAQDDTISRHTYNARSETAATKPSFRKAWRQRQFGLVLVDDFFEPDYATGRAVRWRIRRDDGGPMAIASLWDRWADPATGEQVVSFAMLTINADAHPVMNRFHRTGEEKRTPVALLPSLHEAWLQASPDEAMALLTTPSLPTLQAEAAPRS